MRAFRVDLRPISDLRHLRKPTAKKSTQLRAVPLPALHALSFVFARRRTTHYPFAGLILLCLPMPRFALLLLLLPSPLPRVYGLPVHFCVRRANGDGQLPCLLSARLPQCSARRSELLESPRFLHSSVP